MIRMMPEENAGLLFTGSSPPPRLWVCQMPSQGRAVQGHVSQDNAGHGAWFNKAGTSFC